MEPSANGYTLTFPGGLVFSDEELFDFCKANPLLNIERDSQKRLIIMSPTTYLSGHYESILIIELGLWNKQHGLGKVFSSSTGFTLPDGSMRSPDAAWISTQSHEKLSEAQKHKFAPICPEFVAEILSPSDSLSELKSKMLDWVANGIQLGWLIDVKNETVYIYDHSGLVKAINSFEGSLSEGAVLPDFVFDLKLFRE